VNELRLKKFRYVDKQGTGMEAFSMLMPASWKFEGGIRWLLDNPGMPAVAAFRVFNPAGFEEFEVFPNQPFCWTDNQMTRKMFPVGSRYFGNEVHPPMNPLEALKRVVLPRFRKNIASLKIIHEESLPDLGRQLGVAAQPGTRSSAVGAKMRVQYQTASRTIEEEFYDVVESYSFMTSTMTGRWTNTIWTVDYIFSFKAEQGQLDAAAGTFQAITRSFKLNPRWYGKCAQLIDHLIKQQIRQIQNVGQLSRMLSQMSNEMSDMNMKSYTERQAVNDRISENFSHHILDIESYHNPFEDKAVELPSGYNHAWVNNLGEYVMTDDPNFNPNVGSNLHWENMEKHK
jgi:hypothetical protein